MHSIRTRILLLFGGSLLGVFLLLAAVSLFHFKQVTEMEADGSMDMLVQQKARQLNAYFEGLERAVKGMEEHVKELEDPDAVFMEEESAQAFLQELASQGTDMAKVAGNVYALYFRLDPDRYDRQEGFFLIDNGYGEYAAMTLTDLSKFEQDDREHVAWYYEPIENGMELWLKPYLNRNIDVYMTSYVSPVYVNGRFVGVVGMDLDMAIVQNIVDSVEYQNGQGFLLEEDGDIIYSRSNPEGLKASYLDEELKEARNYFLQKWPSADLSARITWKGKEQRIITQKLRNGMILAISIPEAEIQRPMHRMERQMFFIFLCVLVIGSLAGWRIMVSIVRPIRELTNTASKIAKGELNTDISYRSKNEIGLLASSINSMAGELREYINYIHSQAYMDAMTGVGNKSSYLDTVRVLERKMQEGMADFAVAVFDMNGLKTINDQYGHEIGDRYITDAASVIKGVFGAEHTYRIGGDEFIVILENASKERVSEEFRRFDEKLRELNQQEDYQKEPLAVSKGSGFYDAKEDQAYREVFKKADMAMYQDKSLYYQGRKERRRR